jgi:hypothetical protein
MGFERLEPVERRIDIGGRPVSIWRPPDMESLIDLAAFEADERIPYWADVWESAIVLAEDLAAMNGAGKTLLEENRERHHAPNQRVNEKQQTPVLCESIPQNEPELS